MHGSLGNENKHKMRKEKPAQKECKRYAKKIEKNFKKVLDCLMEVLYNSTCVTGNKKCRDEIHN